jgi:hypothetical protein
MTTLQLPAGWTPALTEVRKRLICSIAAPKGFGKTTLALGAQEPIFYYKFETGDEGVIEPIAATGKEIYTHRVYYNRGNWKECWDAFMDHVVTTCVYLLQTGVGTIIFDTFTEVYELARLAHFGGRLAQVLPREYGVVYADLKEVIRMVEGAGINGVFVHKMGTAWESSELEVKGWSDHKWDMQVMIEMHRFDADPETGAPIRFLGHIKECRQKGSLVGGWLEGEAEGIDAGGVQRHPLSFDYLLRWVHA